MPPFFQNLKDFLSSYLTSPPLLKLPRVGETLYLYLAGYFKGNNCNSPSKSIRHSPILSILSRKLSPYFQAHLVVVMTNQLIKEVTKWSIELAEFGVEFSPKTIIKGQILVDFIIERSFEKLVNLEVTCDELTLYSNISFPSVVQNLVVSPPQEGVDTTDNSKGG
ncbi:protein SRG1 [Gossypium australe]|uniref:Protein SRG1 n=1 Tax=Gossypium australe TaxID=47621 RepID=A0A5B6UVZ0_9ROSI|nr:protein SRG1 [Gossypium australe]